MANWQWLLVFLYSLLLCLSLIGTSRTQEEDVDTIVVVWNRTAVQQYTPDSPLEVKSGDKLIFQCPNGSFSNLWYQPALAQYNSCDCTIGSPDCQRIGECIGTVKNFTQNINANSGDLATVAVYEPGQMYYFTSFSDGTFRGAISEFRRTGGECEELRMAIRVLDVTTTTEPSPESSPSPGPTFGPSIGNGNTNSETPATPGNIGGPGDNGDGGGGNTNVGGPGEPSTDIDIGSGNTGATDTTGGTVIPVVLATFSSNIPLGGGGLLTHTDHTNIPIIVGAVAGGMILIIIALIVVVVLVRCHSRKKVTFDPDAELKTTQPNGVCEQIKADLEKGESFGVNKQTELEKNKSNIKQKSSAQKETKIDPEKGTGTAVNRVGNAKGNKLKPIQQKVACDDSEIASEKGKLADANTTTITVAAAAAAKTTKTTAKTTTETSTTSKGGNATNNEQGKSSLQVEKPKSNNLKPAPPPPSASQRGGSTGQPVSKKQQKQEGLATSQKKTGNRSEPRKNSSSADQLTAPSEHTNGSVKHLPPLAKQPNATIQQEAKSGTGSYTTS